MRPLKLTLKGFTCYSDPVEIDFSHMELFVISGPTGAGKSTIVDAICYALYGRVPRVDGTTALISHNRDEMRVGLEFSAGGAVYRVVRSINRSSKTAKDGSEQRTKLTSPVQFEQRQGQEWLPLADRTREIDKQIERVLGLDFNGFTRCIVLPQGQFQEFLSGDAQKRRALLTELLDIKVYGDIMTAANARAAKLKQEGDGLDRRLAEDYAAATPEALESTRKEAAALEPQLAAARRERDALQQAVELAGRVTDARGRERELKARHATAVAEAADLRSLAADGEEQLARLRAQIATIEEDLAGLQYDRERHESVRAAIDAAKRVAGFTQEHEAALRAAQDTALLERSVAAVAEGEGMAAAATAAREDAEEKRDAARRADAAEHLRGGLKKGDPCPVCGAAVGTLPKVKGGNIAAAEKAVVAAKAAEKRCHDELAAAVLARQKAQQSLDHAREEALKCAERLAQAREHLVEVLPADIAPEEKAIAAALVTLDASAKREECLTSDRDAARRQLDDLRTKVEAAAQDLAARNAAVDLLLAQACAAGAEAIAAREELSVLTAEWQWEDVREAIESKQQPGDMLRKRHQDCLQTADAMTARTAQLAQSVAKIEQDIEKAVQIRGELETVRRSSALYTELGYLLRADKFQRFVIEEAMEALAETATRHMATLYDRFTMTVEGGEFFVVDHWQADQKRSARTLSGGETFVASLALALALSERLPELRNRNAAVLESLFLDEGFGTLDAGVLDIVITALENLRSEERMVGIITHVPDLARRIDSRIEVKKSPAGSSAAVA